MNFSKPSAQELKTENDILKMQVESLQKEIKANKQMIEKLRNKLEKDKGGKE